MIDNNSSNFVFFWGSEDYYKAAFSDIENLSNVIYIQSIPRTENRILTTFHKIHNSTRINKRLNIPFKNIWFPLYFSDSFENENKIVFVFHAAYYWLKGSNYFEYLRRKYPTSKLVFILMDTVDSYKRYFADRFTEGFDISYLRKSFDLLLTYNKSDSEKFNIEYYPSIYSTRHASKNEEPTYDIFFVGRAKDRLSDIHYAYKKLTEKGFACNFYISGVEPKRQEYPNRIHYNEYLSYNDVIKNIQRTRGLLEIVQGNSNGFTFRLDEALVFDKNIITNNPIVTNIPYRDSEKIFNFETINDITYGDFLKASLQSYHYQGDYSPVKLLEYLENKFRENV